MLSTFGALTGIVLAGPRVYYSMAQDGLVFRWLGTSIRPTGRHPRDRGAGRVGGLLAATGASIARCSRA